MATEHEWTVDDIVDLTDDALTLILRCDLCGQSSAVLATIQTMPACDRRRSFL